MSGSALRQANRLRRILYSHADRLLDVVAPLRPRMLRQEPGAVAAGSRSHLCIFAHYDPHGRIDDYVLYHLRALAEAGRETVLVSTAPGIDEEGLERAKACCRSILIRENRGHDFASWQAGLRHVAVPESWETLTLANDSVYGPLQPLQPVFARMGRRDLDVWGVTDSHEFSWHLQSYFLVFTRRVTESSVFKRFWEKFPVFRYRQSVIREGEINLSRRLRAAGFRLGALCEYEGLARRHPALVRAREQDWILGGPANSSLALWRLLIEREACPFLKVGLLRDNKLRARNVDQWLRVLQASSDYDPRLIHDHLARVCVRCVSGGSLTPPAGTREMS